MNYSINTFTHTNKYGKIEGSFHFDEQKSMNEYPIIKEFIKFCKNNGFPVDMCRMIKSIEVTEGCSVGDCLNHYIKYITRRERYGIANDTILIDAYIGHQFLEDLKNANFVSISNDNDPVPRYYVHKNGFVRALINKLKEIKQ